MNQGGYTYITTYQTCRRMFYFRYILRWESVEKNEKMIWGSILHAMTGLLTYNRLALHRETDLRKEYDALIKSEGLTNTQLINAGWSLLTEWKETYLPMDDDCEVCLIDELVGFDIDGFLFYIKPDRVLFNRRTQMVKMFELKTTGYSLPVVMGKVRETDQSTAYIWGWNQRFPQTLVKYLIPEVLYAKGNVIRISRGDPIYRNQTELIRFENDLRLWISEITQRVNNPDPRYFQKRWTCMEGSAFKCEYASICPQVHDPGDIPPGFRLREITL
jgi:hypothetical protein